MKKIICSLLIVALMSVMLAPAVFAAGTSVTVSDITAKPGDEVTVDVTVSGNTGFGAATFDIVYDADVLTLTEISVDNTLFGKGTGVQNVAKNRVNCASATAITGDGVLFTLTFEVKAAAADGKYEVSVEAKNFADTKGADIAVTVEAGEVSVATPHVCSGTLVKAKDATCTEAGNIAYYVCECGKLYSDEECTKEITLADTVVKALGHDWEAATCTEPKTCKVCGETEGEALGHDWEWVVDEEATCGKDGKKHEECKVCGEKRNEGTKIDATGDHKWEWVVDKEATTTEEGEKHEECKVCGNKRNEGTKIPMIDDVPEMGDNTTIYVIFALVALVSLAGVYYTTKKFNK